MMQACLLIKTAATKLTHKLPREKEHSLVFWNVPKIEGFHTEVPNLCCLADWKVTFQPFIRRLFKFKVDTLSSTLFQNTTGVILPDVTPYGQTPDPAGRVSKMPLYLAIPLLPVVFGTSLTLAKHNPSGWFIFSKRICLPAEPPKSWLHSDTELKPLKTHWSGIFWSLKILDHFLKTQVEENY